MGVLKRSVHSMNSLCALEDERAREREEERERERDRKVGRVNQNVIVNISLSFTRQIMGLAQPQEFTALITWQQSLLA